MKGDIGSMAAECSVADCLVFSIEQQNLFANLTHQQGFSFPGVLWVSLFLPPQILQAVHQGIQCHVVYVSECPLLTISH